MKKTLLTNLKFIAFGLVIALSINAYAAWTAPTGSAPANNVDVPLHVGPDQIKIDAPASPNNSGGLSVGSFIANQNAEFDQQVFFNGMIRGGNGSTADSQVSFGDSSHVVNANVKGDTSAKGLLTNNSLSNTQATTLCAATDGTISLCGAAVAQKETYAVSAQQLVYPVPDYAYTPGGQQYILSICLSSPAQRSLPFTIKYTGANGAGGTAGYIGSLTINPGQNCAQTPLADGTYAVLSAPATKVPPATNQCTYQGNDTTYQSPAYQGYAVTVDPSIQCH
jgi:hypothetical protein